MHSASPCCRTPSVIRGLGVWPAPCTEPPFPGPARPPCFARLGGPSAPAADTSQLAEESTPRTIQHRGLLSAARWLRKGRKGPRTCFAPGRAGRHSSPLQHDLASRAATSQTPALPNWTGPPGRGPASHGPWHLPRAQGATWSECTNHTPRPYSALVPSFHVLPGAGCYN